MILLAILAAAAAPQPGELKTFRDWTVGCDNVLSCHATSLMPEEGEWEDVLGLSVKRDAGPAGAPVISLLGTGDAAALAADGKRLPLRLGPGDEELRVIAADTTAAIEAFRSARQLTVLDGEGKALGRISLAGLSAALLYIDDRQQRVGTATALARSGTKPASAVPPAPAIPMVRSAAAAQRMPLEVDAARIAALRKDSECTPEEPDHPAYGVEQLPLDADHTLILLGCGAGAYNTTEIPYVARRHGRIVDVQIAAFDHEPTSGERPPMLVNAGWAADEGLLTSFAKGRGIGDCGVGSDYAWDGARFRLVNQIEMGTCRGSLDYIRTWQARVVRR
jgi:hypothetical protein